MILIIGSAGMVKWSEGPVQDEEKLKDQFQHLASYHMMDDVGTQVKANASGYVPPALKEARERVEAELKKTNRYNAICNMV
ncbi:MAG: hypothetical protein JWO78_341 [Micavibrio sp.]|nr:hypothetical protein [Micavibrio sp.]